VQLRKTVSPWMVVIWFLFLFFILLRVVEINRQRLYFIDYRSFFSNCEAFNHSNDVFNGSSIFEDRRKIDRRKIDRRQTDRLKIDRRKIDRRNIDRRKIDGPNTHLHCSSVSLHWYRNFNKASAVTNIVYMWKALTWPHCFTTRRVDVWAHKTSLLTALALLKFLYQCNETELQCKCVLGPSQPLSIDLNNT
jgi:ABC-type maltose transport system permease subunit